MTERVFNLDVAPNRVQSPSAIQSVGPLPFYHGCRINIRAEGTIWSGVVLTCRTVPGGWLGYVVNSADTNWPCHDDRGTQYSLIARLDDGPFFFVGGGKSLASREMRTEPPQQVTLHFAVNRPRPELTGAGDGAWSVQVNSYEPDAGAPPGPDPELCRLLTSDIADARAAAPVVCEAIGHSIADIDGRWSQVLTATGVTAVATVALIVVALPVILPATLTATTAGHAAMVAAQASLTGLVTTLAPAGPIGAGFSALVTALIAIPSATVSVGTATAIGAANASPVGLTPFGTIVIIALSIIAAAALVTTIGLLLDQIRLASINANARVDWTSLIDGLRDDISQAREACIGAIDDTIPTCASLRG